MEPGRRQKLKSTSVYSAAVRAEVLLVKCDISSELYSKIELARKDRNEVAHRASLDIQRAKNAGEAMCAMLSDHLQTTVAPTEVMEVWGF